MPGIPIHGGTSPRSAELQAAIVLHGDGAPPLSTLGETAADASRTIEIEETDASRTCPGRVLSRFSLLYCVGVLRRVLPRLRRVRRLRLPHLALGRLVSSELLPEVLGEQCAAFLTAAPPRRPAAPAGAGAALGAGQSFMMPRQISEWGPSDSDPTGSDSDPSPTLGFRARVRLKRVRVRVGVRPKLPEGFLLRPVRVGPTHTWLNCVRVRVRDPVRLELGPLLSGSESVRARRTILTRDEVRVRLHQTESELVRAPACTC
eukprot:gene24211-biopygen10420